MKPFAALGIGALYVYRVTLSPALYALGVRCRHEPSCSAYAIDAMRAHGAWAGAWMALARLCRCRPGGSSGLDPAPKRARGPWWRPWRYGVWRLRKSEGSPHG